MGEREVRTRNKNLAKKRKRKEEADYSPRRWSDVQGAEAIVLHHFDSLYQWSIVFYFFGEPR